LDHSDALYNVICWSREQMTAEKAQPKRRWDATVASGCYYIRHGFEVHGVSTFIWLITRQCRRFAFLVLYLSLSKKKKTYVNFDLLENYGVVRTKLPQALTLQRRGHKYVLHLWSGRIVPYWSTTTKDFVRISLVQVGQLRNIVLHSLRIEFRYCFR
jgi:hypothetical protein